MDEVVLAVDVGSTRAKAQYFDSGGRPLGPPVRARMPIDSDGTADPRAVAAAVDSVVDGALEQEGRSGPPAAVALSCAWHGLVGVGKDGSPTTVLSTWQHTGPEIERAAVELRRRLPDPAAVMRRTGAPIHPSFPAVRLRALAATCPEAVAATVRWCSTAEWLETRWFAAAPGPSSSMASGTGCYDQEAGGWDGEVLDAAGVTSGTFVPIDDSPRNALDGAYRKRWPDLAGAVWLPAVGDGACALVGTGCAGSRAALTVGTTAAVRVLAPPTARAGRPTALFAYLLDPGRLVLGAARSNAGNLLEWAGRVLRADVDDPVAAATARPPGSHGLVADPALAGERSPHWPLVATGSVSGLRHRSTALDLVQAFLESAVLGLADGLRALEAYVGPVTLVASGGAVSASAGWPHLLADATGHPVVLSRVAEASARGAALLALERLGGPAVAASTADDGEIVEPDTERAVLFSRMPRTARGAG
ncbi:MAG: FGGY-family carbohydrate kinase [Actinomycetota bacterium]|nr:FGGY-family carbohydrate kinase [Actinomycetota bacterium]